MVAAVEKAGRVHQELQGGQQQVAPMDLLVQGMTSSALSE